MDARTDRAWNGFAADVAVWIDRAGEQLSAIAHAHGVKVSRHEIETALESIVGTVEDKHAIEPRPETATVDDVRAGFAGMAARVLARSSAQQWASAAGDIAVDAYFDAMDGSKDPGASSPQWRDAARTTAIDAYLDGMAVGARIDAFAASIKAANR
ncbi:hypothetical protein [Rhodococcoides fascians]|uniref:hypothetical protein n=1 Tax=Rhodococcoides fascians TaxID=1828 RepID=UPI000568170C|nr:hypothetical protein [Rhodococcus fascians]